MPDTTQIQDPISKLHAGLVSEKLFSGSIDDFKSKYNNQNKIDELFNELKVTEKYTKDKFSFYEKYFPEQREKVSHERLYKGMKASGYEGTEKDFRETYRTDESISRLFGVAKQKEMFSGDEEQFIQKYFPSKAKPSKAQNAAFDNRFDPFTQKKNLGGTTSSPTKLPSQESVKPKEYTKPSEKTNIFGGTFKEPSATPPEGTADLGASQVDVKKLSEKKQTESEKKRAEVYKRHGKTVGRVHDVFTSVDEFGSAFTNRLINIPADLSDAVGVADANIKKAAMSLASAMGVSDEALEKQKIDIEKQDARQAAVAIRKFANYIAPANPDTQDDILNVIAGTLPDMGLAIITGGASGVAAATGYYAATGLGQGFNNAYTALSEMDKDIEGYIAQRAQSPEDAEVIRSEYKRFKESGQSIYDAATTSGFFESLIQTSEVMPVMGFIKKIDKYTGGAVKKGVLAQGGAFFDKFMKPVDGVVTRGLVQGAKEGLQEIFQNTLSNINAKESYDFSRNLLTGLDKNAEAGFTLGTVIGMLLPHKMRLRNETSDPIERAIIDADIEKMQSEKQKYDENPDYVSPEPELKNKLADALEEDVTPEAAKAISKKLDELNNPKEDKGELARIIERQYNDKINALKIDMESLPDEAKSEVKKRIDELKAEKIEAINRVYPDSVEVEAPKKKTIEDLDEVKYYTDYYNTALSSEYEWERNQSKKRFSLLKNDPIKFFEQQRDTKNLNSEDYYFGEERRKEFDDTINEIKKIKDSEAPKKKTLKEKLAEQKAKEAEALQDRLKKAREKPTVDKVDTVEDKVQDTDDYENSIDKEQKKINSDGPELWQIPYVGDSGVKKGSLGVTEKGQMGYAINIDGLQKKLIEDSLNDGKYELAIKNGSMTAGYAKRIIESVGLEVPEDILIDAGVQKSKINKSKVGKDIAAAKEEQVQQKPEVPEVKGVDKVEDALELEKEAKLKSVGKPEVKMEFIQKKDLRKAKDIEGTSKEHRRIMDEHKVLRSFLDCIWA